MKIEEKINYLKKALKLQNYLIEDSFTERVTLILEAINNVGKDISLKEIVEIDEYIKQTYQLKNTLKIDNPTLENLNSLIKELRLKEKVKQEDLAELLDVSQAYISAIERGAKKVTFEQSIVIIKQLGYSLDLSLSKNLE